MRMLNQAIEDAAAFSEFRDALTRRNPNVITDGTNAADPAAPKHQGESRQQYRARMRAEQKAAKKAKA